jgi:uncharacterized OB-fold protein
VIALVTPEEAPDVRIPSRIADIEPDEAHIGMAVKADIVPLAGGDYRIAVFRPT